MSKVAYYTPFSHTSNFTVPSWFKRACPAPTSKTHFYLMQNSLNLERYLPYNMLYLVVSGRQDSLSERASNLLFSSSDSALRGQSDYYQSCQKILEKSLLAPSYSYPPGHLAVEESSWKKRFECVSSLLTIDCAYQSQLFGLTLESAQNELVAQAAQKIAYSSQSTALRSKEAQARGLINNFASEKLPKSAILLFQALGFLMHFSKPEFNTSFVKPYEVKPLKVKKLPILERMKRDWKAFAKEKGIDLKFKT